MSEATVVRFDVEDGIGVITVDYPPVNALGPGVSDGIISSAIFGPTMRGRRCVPPPPGRIPICTSGRPTLAEGTAMR